MTWTIQTASRLAVGCAFILPFAIIGGGSAQADVLPVGAEQQEWSDMAFAGGVTGTFDAGTKQLTVNATASNDLEIGGEYGPENPGRHYGIAGTLGGSFSALLDMNNVVVQPDGTVTNGGSFIVIFNAGTAGSIGTDYGIGAGTLLLTGSVVEVLLDATGDNTLDVAVTITGGALQTDNPDPNVGVFAPDGFAVLRFAGVAIPSDFTGSFNLDGASIDVLSVPEPASFGLLALAGIGLIRRRRGR